VGGLKFLVSFCSKFLLHPFELLLGETLSCLVVVITLDLRKNHRVFVTMGAVVGVVLLVLADVGLPPQVGGIDSGNQ